MVFIVIQCGRRVYAQRHEVQPDVYCRRLGLQVPVAVSVKDGQIADVFHAICGIALNPLSAIPGGADRSMTPAARVRLYVTWTAVLGGATAGLMMVYRTLLRPTGIVGNWSTLWTGWILGRREL